MKNYTHMRLMHIGEYNENRKMSRYSVCSTISRFSIFLLHFIHLNTQAMHKRSNECIVNIHMEILYESYVCTSVNFINIHNDLNILEFFCKHCLRVWSRNDMCLLSIGGCTEESNR